MSKLGKRMIKSVGQAITMAQLQNDLDAARKHIANYRESELKLVDRLNALTNQQHLTATSLSQAIDERNDWRDAFKLIMKLMK